MVCVSVSYLYSHSVKPVFTNNQPGEKKKSESLVKKGDNWNKFEPKITSYTHFFGTVSLSSGGKRYCA